MNETVRENVFSENALYFVEVGASVHVFPLQECNIITLHKIMYMYMHMY